MKKQINVRIAKTDESERTATGLIYAPLIVDSQNDFMTAPDIKAASQRFMKSGRTRSVDVNHSGVAIDAFVSESMISRGGDFPDGSWVVTTKIDDDAVWKAVRDGTLTGFSMMGTCSKHLAKINGKDARQISDLDVRAISLVGKAANMEKFSVIKSDNSIEALAAQFEQIAVSIQQTTEAIQQGFERQQAQIDSLTQGADGRVVKAAPVVNPNADKIRYQFAKRERLQSRLESLWERPDLAGEATESALRRKIAKCSDELYALGHEAPRADLETNSAFLFRGGESHFLVATPSSLGDILGVTRDGGIHKSEDEINVECCLVL